MTYKMLMTQGKKESHQKRRQTYLFNLSCKHKTDVNENIIYYLWWEKNYATRICIINTLAYKTWVKFRWFEVTHLSILEVSDCKEGNAQNSSTESWENSIIPHLTTFLSVVTEMWGRPQTNCSRCDAVMRDSSGTGTTHAIPSRTAATWHPNTCTVIVVYCKHHTECVTIAVHIRVTESLLERCCTIPVHTVLALTEYCHHLSVHLVEAVVDGAGNIFLSVCEGEGHSSASWHHCHLAPSQAHTLKALQWDELRKVVG